MFKRNGKEFYNRMNLKNTYIDNKILKLSPALKDYIWGGKRLKEEYGKKSETEIVAESWELSCHKNGMTRIIGGKYDGLTLGDVISCARECGEDWLGTNCKAFKAFPLLIKLIDANNSLSVQVHPDDIYAKCHENGGNGKTEVWYVVEAAPDAELIYGLACDVTKDEFKTAIENNELKKYLKSVKVKAGDVFFVEAGLIHAIGKGIVICEIQQNSDTTYRVYDWGRMGADGKPRELHIEKALDVMTLTKNEVRDFSPELIFEKDGVKEYKIADCNYFNVKKREQTKQTEIATDGNSFVALTFLKGSGYIESENEKVEFTKGESVFIPAVPDRYIISGKCEYLITAV